MKKVVKQKENFLSEVHSRTPEWNFNVYVVRLWEVPHKFNPNEVWYIEMTLQDSKKDPRDMLTKEGKDLKRLAIIVEDIEKNRINCTLFDQHVEGILPYLDESREDPLVVVLQYFRATRWNGKTSIQSNFAVSKVRINSELDEVVPLRDSLLTGGSGTSSKITHVSSSSSVTALQELRQPNAKVMKIDEVVKCTQECIPWIAGTIVALNNGLQDWFYNACAGCHKKVDCSPKGKYQCTNEKCLQTGDKPRKKYKVELMVYDGTECVNLLMWDTQVIQLCGKRPEQVAKEDMTELGCPPTLDKLVERSALWKINVKSNNIEKEDRVYTISNICENEDLVKKYLPDDFTSQGDGTITEMGGSNSAEISQQVADFETGHDDIPKAVGEDSVSTKTPAKRILIDDVGGSSAAVETKLEEDPRREGSSQRK